MRGLLISPAGAGTTRIAQALDEEGVESAESSELGAGSALAAADLSDFDFAVVVVGRDLGSAMPAGSAAVLLEAGVMLGRGIPTLVIAEPESVIPPAIDRLPSALVDLDDVDSLRLHLRLFARGLANWPVGLASGRSSATLEQRQADEAAEELRRLRSSKSPELEVRLEQLVFETLRAAGAIVEAAPQDRRDIDGAFVVPGEEQRIGYVLVEVKRLRSTKALNDAQSKLQMAVLDRRAGLGLLLYDSDERRPLDSQVTPLVIALPIEGFIAELTKRSLAAVVLNARNDAVHRL